MCLNNTGKWYCDLEEFVHVCALVPSWRSPFGHGAVAVVLACVPASCALHCMFVCVLESIALCLTPLHSWKHLACAGMGADSWFYPIRTSEGQDLSLAGPATAAVAAAAAV